jgi:hypothetical protein
MVAPGAGMQYATPANYYGAPMDSGAMGGEVMSDGSCSCSDCQASMSDCGGCGDCDACGYEPNVLFGGSGGGWFHGDGRGYHVGAGIGSLLAFLLPYGEGGCCAPHWFDLHAEAVFLKRDNSDEPFWEFSRLGPQGPAVITSDDLAFDTYEPSMRITGTYQTGPGSNLEFTYFGLNDYSESQSAISEEDQLYAVFDNFSLDDEGNPDPESEIEQLHQAEFQKVKLDSDFDSLELNFRRRWTSSSCLVQGSWLVGVRYIDLSDTLQFDSLALRDTEPPAGEDDSGGAARYLLKTRNFMTGGQLGGDVWVCLLPGLRLGFDGKAGIFGNNAKVDTTFTGFDPFDPSGEGFIGFIDPERLDNDKVTFMGEAALLLTYQVNARLALRGGYQVVYFDGVATALSNFNPTVTDREPFMDDGASLTYDGFNAGFEWMW